MLSVFAFALVLFVLAIGVAVPLTVVGDLWPSSRAIAARKAALAESEDAASGFEGLGSIGADPLAAAIAGSFTLLGPVFALAFVPFGFTYAFGGEATTLVAATAAWSVLALPVGLLVSGLGLFGVLASLGDEHALEEGLRLLTQLVVSQIALLLAIAAPCLLFGSLDLHAMTTAQDGVLSPLAVFGGAVLLEGGASRALGGLALPAWGAVFDLPALLLFLVAAGLAGLRAPIGAADPARGRRERVLDGAGPAGQLLFAIAGRLEQLVIAGFAVALFLGGGAIPYVSSETLAGAISARLGDAVGNGLAVVIHVLAFSAKAVAVMALQSRLVVWWPADRPRAQIHFAGRLLIPIALLNLAVLVGGLVVVSGGVAWR